MFLPLRGSKASFSLLDGAVLAKGDSAAVLPEGWTQFQGDPD
jgi:hypothetical protein